MPPLPGRSWVARTTPSFTLQPWLLPWWFTWLTCQPARSFPSKSGVNPAGTSARRAGTASATRERRGSFTVGLLSGGSSTRGHGDGERERQDGVRGEVPGDVSAEGGDRHRPRACLRTPRASGFARRNDGTTAASACTGSARRTTAATIESRRRDRGGRVDERRALAAQHQDQVLPAPGLVGLLVGELVQEKEIERHEEARDAGPERGRSGGGPWTHAAPQIGKAPRPRPAKISPTPARAKTSE